MNAIKDAKQGKNMKSKTLNKSIDVHYKGSKVSRTPFLCFLPMGDFIAGFLHEVIF